MITVDLHGIIVGVESPLKWRLIIRMILPSLINCIFMYLFFTINRGIDLAGSTIGIAYVGTMCSQSSSVGVTQDWSHSVDAVGSTAAHELGHNFNMDHDNGPQSMCNYHATYLDYLFALQGLVCVVILLEDV